MSSKEARMCKIIETNDDIILMICRVRKRGCAVPDIVSRCQKYENSDVQFPILCLGVRNMKSNKIIETNYDIILMICRVRKLGCAVPDIVSRCQKYEKKRVCAVPGIVSRCQKYKEQQIIETNNEITLMICRVRKRGCAVLSIVSRCQKYEAPDHSNN
ncbi:hypothetical protein J6590_027897 [Homalodisca vitripennis]|nr:hypothetical protein J6590_027897 [Homalodisca vitripennis]